MTRWKRHTVRFAVVGISSNLLLYLLYLIITSLGAGHKVTMTGLYLLGVAQTFFLNKTWTFAHSGKMHAALGRYLVAYAFGYILNWGLLYFFVDNIGFPHQLVQGIAILVVAIFMFIIQRYWVFSQKTTDSVSENSS